MIRRTLASTDFYVAAGLIFALFLGNASFGGFPLIVLFSLCSLVFIPLYRPRIFKAIFIAVVAAIFLLYSIRANISYDKTYPLWVLSFFLGYFYTTLANSRMLYSHNSFSRMLFRAAFIALVIFAVGCSVDFILTSGQRSSFIFGPNMLYRVFGCLSGLVAGYLFLDGRKLSGLIVMILAVIFLVITGSRAALFIIAALLFVWVHAHTKIISFRRYMPFLIVLIVSGSLFFALVDVGNTRLLGYSHFVLEEGTSYSEGYIRWRPYLYFLFEPDRFSLIGIDYAVFFRLFGADGFLYPHNVFLELVMFYGFFGIFVSLYFIIKLYKLVRRLSTTICTRVHILYYSIIISSIGTLFSGDLGDNGVYLGAVMAMSNNVFIQRKKLT